MNAISCLTWVKRGGASRHPDRVRIAAGELSNLINVAQKQDADGDGDSLASEDDSDGSESQTKLTLDDQDGGGDDTGPSSETNDDEDTDDGHDVDDIDEDDDIEEDDDIDEEDDDDDEDDIDKRYGLTGYENEAERTISMAGIANPDDPYMPADESDADSEADDLEVTPDDNLLVIGKVSNEFCNLEVHVYNENDSNLYCHHDVILPSFPLAMEWLDFDPAEDEPGNFVAISSMTPEIEIWDIDVVNSLEAAFVLGSGKRKKKKLGSMSGHTDAVLDLSWNRLQRNVLASASADFTIGLWDLTTGKMASSFEDHVEKVQALQWHPFEAQSLLSGGFDRTVRVYDCRSADVHKTWTLAGEVERVTWNHHDPYHFLASTDTGHVYYVDVRQEGTVFTLKAHTSAVTGLVLSSGIAGCLLTASTDKTVKVWDIRDNKPAIVHSQDMKMGELHCAQSCPDASLVFAIGGEREFRVFNLKKNAMVAKCFDLNKKEVVVSEDDTEGAGKANKKEKRKKKKTADDIAAESVNDGDGQNAEKKIRKKKKKMTDAEDVVHCDSNADNILMKKRKKEKGKKKNKVAGEDGVSKPSETTVVKKSVVAQVSGEGVQNGGKKRKKKQRLEKK